MIIAFTMVIAFSIPAGTSASVSGNDSQHHTYIITFKPSAISEINDKGTVQAKAMDEERSKKIESIPGKLKYSYKIINAIAMDLPDSAVEALKSRKDIESILPDMMACADLNEVPDHINATAAWHTAPGYTGAGINVSVIDSGIDVAHPDLQGKVLQWYDFVNGRTTPYDDWGHGTYVAGIIAGTGSSSNGLYKGVAYGANLFSAKVLNPSGTAYVSDIIAAIEWSVQNNADVISMSLSNPIHYQSLDDAVHNAVENGVVVVCSAGNTGPAPGTIRCPSDAPDAITVGSTSIYDQISSFSSRGPTWDSRTKPDLVAVGESVISTRASAASMGTPISYYYSYVSGTSSACPQISGACAILLQANQNLSPAEVKNALVDTSIHLGTVYPNNNTGWGRPDVWTALSKVLPDDTIQDPITFHVQNGSGTAIQGTSVTIGSQTITTDASGNAQFMLNRGVPVNIHVTATGYEAYEASYTPNGEAAVDVILTLIPLKDEITVHVENNRAAMWGASVTIGSQKVTTGADGNAQFMLNRGVPVNIHVTATGYEAYDTSYTPNGEATVDVTLQDQFALRTYVANNGGNTVSVIDQRTNTVTGTIITGAKPMGITYSPDGSLVYVAVESLNKVAVISTASDTIVGNISVGKTPRGLAMSRDGSRLYVGNYGGESVSIVDTTNPGSYTVIKTVTGIKNSHQLWIDPDGDRLYSGTYQSNSVYVINTTADNGTIVSTLTGNKPYYVSLDPSGNRLFVANYGANNIQVYDTGTLSLLKTIPTAMRPMSPLVSPDGTRLYYVTDGNSNLVIADAASYATIKTVRCGSGVRGIACSPDGTKVYVTNMYSNSVTVVNVAGDIGNVIATVSVGSYPYGLEQFAGFY